MPLQYSSQSLFFNSKCPLIFDGGVMLLWYEFSFEAAHFLPERSNEMHGHSYVVRITMKDDFGKDYVSTETELKKFEASAKKKLDHKLLNTIIPTPSSENVARFLWSLAQERYLPVYSIEVYRPTVRIGAIYLGD